MGAGPGAQGGDTRTLLAPGVAWLPRALLTGQRGPHGSWLCPHMCTVPTQVLTACPAAVPWCPPSASMMMRHWGRCPPWRYQWPGLPTPAWWWVHPVAWAPVPIVREVAGSGGLWRRPSEGPVWTRPCNCSGSRFPLSPECSGSSAPDPRGGQQRPPGHGGQAPHPPWSQGSAPQAGPGLGAVGVSRGPCPRRTRSRPRMGRIRLGFGGAQARGRGPHPVPAPGAPAPACLWRALRGAAARPGGEGLAGRGSHRNSEQCQALVCLEPTPRCWPFQRQRPGPRPARLPRPPRGSCCSVWEGPEPLLAPPPPACGSRDRGEQFPQSSAKIRAGSRSSARPSPQKGGSFHFPGRR